MLFCSACCCCTMPASHGPLSSQALFCGSHGTTAVAHHALPFVMVTDSASACACACHVCYRNEHISHERCERMLRRAQDDANPDLLPRDFKSNRASAVTTTAALQQQHNITSASNPGLCDSRGAFGVHMGAVFTGRSCTQSLPHSFLSTYRYN